jgi:hypothetical protein
MCEPTTIAIYAGLALAAVGTAYTVDSTNKNAKAASKQAKEDAKGQSAMADQARQSGNIEEERQLKRVRQMIGAQRAQAASMGIDADMGSALEIQAETSGFGVQDALMIRQNAIRQAWGFDVGQVNALNQGSFARTAARNQNTGTIITGLGDMASMGYSGYQSGAMGKKTTRTSPQLGIG